MGTSSVTCCLSTTPSLTSSPPSPCPQAIGYIFSDPLLKDRPEQAVIKTLEEVGFDDNYRSKLLTELSGGWKMKLALARAMLLNADILLLDGE